MDQRQLERETRHHRAWRVTLPTAVLSTVPGLLARLHVIEVPVGLEAVLYGMAIMGAAFMLSWAAEVAQLDISQALAIAVLALIAVLPEYAVDLVLAFRAGQGDEEKLHLAVANMTGANRLLIGIGWATVVLIFWWKAKKREVTLRREQRTDVGFLLLATLWAFTIPLRRELSLIDLAVLGTMFLFYILRAAKAEVEHPELIGAAAAIGSLRTRVRRLTTLGMFLFAAAAIIAVAEAFAESLIHIGESYGISEFLLIQWVAPLASEAPEMIIAILFTLRLRAQAGLGTLISSKVNQWTLLVGTLPLVFSIAGGAGGGFGTAMEMDPRQVEEVFLTAAQSLFAVAVISSLSISRWEAVMLLVLFLGQFGFEDSAVRYGFAITYLVLTAALLVFDRETRRGLLAAIRGLVQRRAATEPSSR
ncbi:MAG TPA: sodium:calcium antiporter [Actinomycetota bacterium]|nr:sodium:calcium antiporter [Actinomycetota bacterium]